MSNKPDKNPDDQLDAYLRKLPNVPVSSNFTSRVMQQIEREAKAPPSRAMRWNLWLHRFLPRTAVAAVLLAAGVFTMHTVQVHQRKELAQNVATVAKVNPMAQPDVMVDLDAIRRMSQQSPADEEILALMQ
jgi:hypothetical protein